MIFVVFGFGRDNFSEVDPFIALILSSDSPDVEKYNFIDRFLKEDWGKDVVVGLRDYWLGGEQLSMAQLHCVESIVNLNGLT